MHFSKKRKFQNKNIGYHPRHAILMSELLTGTRCACVEGTTSSLLGRLLFFGKVKIMLCYASSCIIAYMQALVYFYLFDIYLQLNMAKIQNLMLCWMSWIRWKVYAISKKVILNYNHWKFFHFWIFLFHVRLLLLVFVFQITSIFK